jgi:hypothetical protein
MPKITSERILHVSVGGEVDTPTHYWRAALGLEDAHMVHYGEMSFGTVFTAPKATLEIEPSFKQRLLRRKNDASPTYMIEDDLKQEMVNGVSDLIREKGWAAHAEPVFYLGKMSAREALAGAESAQAFLVDQVLSIETQ